jgi:hypothetical protein
MKTGPHRPGRIASGHLLDCSPFPEADKLAKTDSIGRNQEKNSTFSPNISPSEFASVCI